MSPLDFDSGAHGNNQEKGYYALQPNPHDLEMHNMAVSSFEVQDSARGLASNHLDNQIDAVNYEVIHEESPQIIEHNFDFDRNYHEHNSLKLPKSGQKRSSG